MKLKEEGHRYTKQTSLTWKLSALGLCLAALALGVAVHWLLRPYDDLTMEVINDGKIVNPVDHREEDGLPVVEPGQVVVFDVETCNKGVSTVTERWMDSPTSQSQSRELASDAPDSITSYSIGSVVFQNETAFCGVVQIRINIPLFVPRNRIYTLRYETTYRPNPIRTVPVTVESEELYLADTMEG